MQWYSDQLLLHGERLCKIAVSIFNTTRPQRCTPRYHSTHPSSPLNPMSLVSDLASVLRSPDQPAALVQPTQGVTELQNLPLHQHSAGQGRALPIGLEAARRSADEPLTPASESAPNPSSWPIVQQELAQDPAQASQEQLQFRSLQPAEPTQLPNAKIAQSGFVLDSQSAASSSSAGPIDGLQFAPPEYPTLYHTDEPAAHAANSPPDRCICVSPFASCNAIWRRRQGMQPVFCAILSLAWRCSW